MDGVFLILHVLVDVLFCLSYLLSYLYLVPRIKASCRQIALLSLSLNVAQQRHATQAPVRRALLGRRRRRAGPRARGRAVQVHAAAAAAAARGGRRARGRGWGGGGYKAGVSSRAAQRVSETRSRRAQSKAAQAAAASRQPPAASRQPKQAGRQRAAAAPAAAKRLKPLLTRWLAGSLPPSPEDEVSVRACRVLVERAGVGRAAEGREHGPRRTLLRV